MLDFCSIYCDLSECQEEGSALRPAGMPMQYIFAYGKQSVGGRVLKVRIINPKGQTFVLLEDSMGVGTNTFFFFFFSLQNE